MEQLTSAWPKQPKVLEVDVTNDAAITSAFQNIQADTGRVNMLLHSIAYASPAAMKLPLVETTRQDFAQAMDISAYSLLALTRSALPLLEAGGGASILSLSYLGAEKVVPTYKVMGPAKAALESLTRGLAVELGPRSIRVNCLSPGPMDTLAARGIQGFTDLRAQAGGKAPLGKLATQADVGAVATFLASDAAAAITGQTWYVDGGLSILA